ncbi:MAG: response regulator [Bradymonadaceae bacterium]
MSAKVLIVEDDADIRHALAIFLRFAGYEIVTACDGAEALALLQDSDPPRLILLDLMMPVMDGWALREEMLGNQELAAIPVLLISGAGDLTQHAATLKAQGFLRKPFTLESVVEAVNEHCAA